MWMFYKCGPFIACEYLATNLQRTLVVTQGF